MLNILWRNIKWRFQNPLSIIVTILQPLIWLVMYSAVAGQAMKKTGIGNYTAFILPGIVVLVTFSACSSGGIINFIMKSNGSFYRILIAPVKRKDVVLGQMLEAILVSFIEVTILFVISLLFSVRVGSGFLGVLLIILLIFLTAFFMSGLAYFISLLLPNEVIYETIMNAIVLPIFFLSTALFPPESLSGGLAIAVNLNPFTHIINSLRRIILGGELLIADILPVIILFTVMCLGSFMLAMWKLKKETLQ
ncbi:ABC transporter permease [Ruminiclostridium cellulolyticum]|uniref:Transport permease protein n=1 Tax=Ruminiclostridium cellulolyticum (strain ATCC 35319 / DSM 5812 / JCM 6584 / H10) TaxID=394503 RepID=B8I0Z4_RUMCH|nr:ABC transporter permease [Ruminiclostridium cellulolyticum]ACL77550.1 ABC-2 type transporter [Ruminiclostridium cellulolyticum H10]